MSSSDDSSSSSSDEGPKEYKNEGPSSHSGLSDEEDDKSKNDELSSEDSSSDSEDDKEKREKSSSSSDDSDNDEKEEKKISSDSSEDDSDKEKDKRSPILDSSDEDEEENHEDDEKLEETVSKVKTPEKDSMILSDSEDEIKPTEKKDVFEEPSESPKLSTDSEDDEPKKKEKKFAGGDTTALPELSSDSDAKSSRSMKKEESDDDITGPRLHPEFEEDETEPPQPPLELKLPLIKGNYGEHGPILTRWPNFISVDTHPFNEEIYEPEEGDISVVDDEGRSRLQLKVENCIRWRNIVDHEKNPILDENGKSRRESNAKIVRWSDGSMTLNVGSEVYGITEQEIKEYNQLFLPFRGALQANAVFKRRYAFRPLTTDSLTHKKMTMQMAEKTNKSQKVKILANVGEDPEAGFANLVRKEEEKLRQNARKEAAQRKMKERQYRSGLTHGFLEDRDEEDEDPDSLSAIKRHFTHPRNRFDRFNDIAKKYYSSEEDEDDSRRIERSKIESDDEAEASTSNKKKDEKKKRKIVISDDED